MMLRWPSALAAATSASMPPHSVTDFADLATHDADPPPDVPPHAATTRNAIAATPTWRVKLANFMLRFPLQIRPGCFPTRWAAQSWLQSGDVARTHLRRVVDFS